LKETGIRDNQEGSAWDVEEWTGNKYTASQKVVRYLIFYNLTKPILIFINFGVQYPDNPIF